MHAEQRIWRTIDGALVREGDSEAAFLAYGLGDEVENRDQARVRDLIAPKAAPAPETKQAPRPRNKQAAKPADK